MAGISGLGAPPGVVTTPGTQGTVGWEAETLAGDLTLISASALATVVDYVQFGASNTSVANAAWVQLEGYPWETPAVQTPLVVLPVDMAVAGLPGPTAHVLTDFRRGGLWLAPGTAITLHKQAGTVATTGVMFYHLQAVQSSPMQEDFK